MSAARRRGLAWRNLLALAWRESRNSRRRLLLFMSSISIGTAALVAIDSYAGNVVRSVGEQSRALLGADLSLTSRQPFSPRMTRWLDSVRATQGTVTTFSSMALVPRTPGTRLVQVRAVSPAIPFYGAIETEPAGRWRRLQAGRNALVDQSLLIALDAHLGDSLSLGLSRFAIIGTLRNVPGDVGIATAFGPRVYIPDRYVLETRLLSFGSRAEYEVQLRLPSGTDADALAQRSRALFQAEKVRSRTVRQTEENLTKGIDQLRRFLGIVGLVALLLGGIGVASGIYAYIAERIDTVAVLRCLGGTSAQVLAIFVTEAAALGLIGSAAGVALGVALQFTLPLVLADFVPVDVHLRLEPTAIAFGLMVGVWVAVLFALAPLLAVRRISPLQALRRDAEALARRPLWRDPARIATGVALAASIAAIALQRSARPRDGIAMVLAIGVAILGLLLSAAFIGWLARRVVRDGWPFVVRQGMANLHRPANQTRAVTLSLGFGSFLISMLYLVQTNLLRQISFSSEASQANLALYDIQEDQLRGVDSLVRLAASPVLQQVAIVPMHIAAINGKDVTALSKARPSWALRREFRSSFRDSLVRSEKLVSGRWEATAPASEPSPISVEQGVVKELGLVLGDRIDWDVQGVTIRTRLASVREVNWARFEPNFFVIFPTGPLAAAPKMFVVMTHGDSVSQRARLQRAIAERYPNVSSIDLSLIQDAVSRILSKVAIAIRFMALFSVGTGALVLFGAVAASRRQRLREGVLLKTLGATRAQIGRIMLAEYAVLGFLGSLTGMILSVGGAWAFVHFIFEAPFRPAGLPMLAIAVGMMLLTITIGVLSGRGVFAETPMAALREA
ncbi:MAG: FtsX-like permease family protein [Gemmatimonadota bacterium]|nr:FtsX-like permease family protein [Gemmatimonadota bacterium]